MDFNIISDIVDIEIIAVGKAIRELPELQERFGHGRWRKLKGVALCAFPTARRAALNFTGTKRMESAKSG